VKNTELKAVLDIADTIECRPVLGHWPHMRAQLDADRIRALVEEYKSLVLALRKIEDQATVLWDTPHIQKLAHDALNAQA
jgi:hypothetical protein